MDTQKKIELIGSAKLFSDLNRSQLEIIASKLTPVYFPQNSLIIEQDDTTNDAYLLLTDGAVRVYRLNENGEEVNLAIRGPGEIIGEMTLLDEKPRSAYVIALKETNALKLSRSDFKKIILEFPQIALNLMKTLSGRIREANEYIESLKSDNLKDRTWNALQSLAQFFPDNQIALSQEELAGIIGATRARVTEILDEFQKSGKITLSHKKIKLL